MKNFEGQHARNLARPCSNSHGPCSNWHGRA